MKAANDNSRLLNRQQAAAYLGVSPSTFSAWVAAGFVPKPLFCSKRWDKKAIDARLDEASGLQKAEADQEEDPLEKWLREANAR